ncbi:MAG TPA: helix-turn-helix transcriptional regulator [Caulobacteraceae bacterium]|nr:helix-turn-helix transcriptional regulator [Caulobacteraceae bacterium]
MRQGTTFAEEGARPIQDPVDVALGARIRIRRRPLGLTQVDLGRRVGVTFPQIQKYERGVNRLVASTLVRLAAALDTTVSALVGEGLGQAVGPETLSNLSLDGAPRLVAAYATIDDAAARQALAAAAAALCGPPPEPAHDPDHRPGHAGTARQGGQRGPLRL